MRLNVLSSNIQYNQVIEEINNQDPDILLLMEVNKAWVNQLSVIQENYPYNIIIAQENNFGMALYSKKEFISKEIHYWGIFNIPFIVAEIKDNSEENLNIIGVHTLPPINKRMYDDNSNQVKFIVDQSRKMDGNNVILGDFNNTSWSKSYRDAIDKNLYYNTASGFFVYTSWYRKLLGGLLIDHIIASRNLYTYNC